MGGTSGREKWVGVSGGSNISSKQSPNSKSLKIVSFRRDGMEVARSF